MPSSTAEVVPRSLLYREIAGQFQRLIQSGTFRPGTRIPSVRALSRQKNVSITTILEAYRVLEDGGFIEARPQSGYFVKPRLLRPVEEPRVSSPPQIARSVTKLELMSMLLRDSANPKLTQLGAAVPPAALLPVEKLRLALGRAARRPRTRPFEPSQGVIELRSQIARRALDWGCDLTPDDVVTTNGCQEAIYFALRAICRPGDTVAVESPAYFGFLQAIELLDLRVLELATYPRHGICIDSLSRSLRRHPVRALLLTTNYSNPLGSCMPDEKKKELVRILARHEIPLIEDDITGDLTHASERPKTAKAFDRKGLVLLCSSFTKTLDPLYRVGFIVPGIFKTAIVHHKMVTNFASATLPQLAIADFLSNGGYDRHLRRMRRILAENVALATQAVVDSFPAGTRVTRPGGGFLLWVELPKPINTLDLYERALEHSITFAPGPLFSAKGSYRNFLRLSVADGSDRTRQAISKLGRLASS